MRVIKKKIINTLEMSYLGKNIMDAERKIHNLAIYYRKLIVLWFKCKKNTKQIERRNSGQDRRYDYLKELKGKFEGQRIFVLATGPSLTIEDLRKLKYENTIGLNSIVDSFDEMGYHPMFFGIWDGRAYKLFHEKVINSDVQYFFIAEHSQKKRKNVKEYIFPDSAWIESYSNHIGKRRIEFSDDISVYVNSGTTVAFAMLQILVYLGFKEIYLLGADCNYSPGVENFNDFRPKKEIQNENTGKGSVMIEAYKVAKEYADKHGIKIYNATRGGMLEVFPRVDLDEVLFSKR